MNKKMPLVSIACITYNQESFIRQCIDGFLFQKTTFPIEIIIHDDASTDYTASIIKEYVDRYPSLIIPIFQTENKYSKGINPGIEFVFPKCKGKYISVCEGDDYWIDPLKLQKQVDFMELNPEYGLIYTDVNFYYEEKGKLVKSIFQNRIIRHTIDFNWHLINTGYFAPCTWLCRREYLPTSDINGYIDGTFPWLLDVMAHSKVHYLPETTATYRVLKNSVSNSQCSKKNIQFRIGVYQIQLDYARKYSVKKNISEMIELRHYENLVFNAILNDNVESLNECFDFFQINHHLQIRTKIVLILSKYVIGRKLIKLIYSIKHKLTL